MLTPVKKIMKSLRSDGRWSAVNPKQTNAFIKEEDTPLMVLEKTITLFDIKTFN
jgi:hypothetical protein